jgi:hypothetical protein
MTDVFITDDKDKMRKMIFDGAEEKAIQMCKEICKYDIYNAMSGFGLYLHKARLKEEEIEDTIKLARSLEKIFDGQKEETHHVWIVLQQVMNFLAGTASEDFKKKVYK